MDKMFKEDSMFAKITTNIFDLIVLNLLWLLFCLPVITIVGSTSALFYATLKMAESNSEQVVKDYFYSFKQNLKQSIGITLIMLVVVAVLFADFYLLRQMSGQIAAMLYGIVIVGALVAIAVFSYVCAMLARFENGSMNMIKNAAKLALVNVPKTIVITAWNVMPFLIVLLAPTILAKLLFLIVLIGGSALALLESHLYAGMFNELIEEE